jgi:hypothetical protein
MPRLRRRLRSESGLTLVEMAVVLVVTGIVLAFSLTSVASFEKAATGGIRRLENLDEARTLMAVISKDIRTAAKLGASSAPFLVADDNTVTFYANLNLSTTCPKKIRLYVNAGTELIEEVTEPDSGVDPPDCGSYTEHAPTTRLVGQYVANDPSEPIFTYWYDNAGVPTAYTITDTPLDASKLLLVNAVGIELAIRKDTNLTVAHTTLMNRVRLPNVYYNPPPSPSP